MLIIVLWTPGELMNYFLLFDWFCFLVLCNCKWYTQIVTFELLCWLCRNDKGDTLNASYYHIVKPLTNTYVGAEVNRCFSTNENTFTVGTQHSLDPLTTVKARVNNFGRASALIQHEWRPKSLFTLSGDVDTKALDKSAKFGLALALKPWKVGIWC